MACVTLKRPLDFDPLEALHSPNRPAANKRRRCTPIKKMERDGLPFRNPAVGKIPANSSSSGSFSSYQQQQQQLQQQQLQQLPSSTASVFKETPLSPAEVANNLRDELKRMKRRRQLVPYVDDTAAAAAAAASPSSSSSAAVAASSSSSIHSAPGSPEPMEGSSSTSSTTNRSSAAAATSSPTAKTAAAAAASATAAAQQQPLSAKALVGTKEKPVFTLKQMSIICERMCQERTDKVRQEYDKILQQKLSEQYDAFVKFIDHQIQQRFNQSQLPSYLS